MPKHVIWFDTDADIKQAIKALRDTGAPRTRLPGRRMIVFDEHIDALNKHGVHYHPKKEVSK